LLTGFVGREQELRYIVRRNRGARDLVRRLIRIDFQGN